MKELPLDFPGLTWTSLKKLVRIVLEPDVYPYNNPVSERDPYEIAISENLLIVRDKKKIEAWVDEAIANNPKAVKKKQIRIDTIIKACDTLVKDILQKCYDKNQSYGDYVKSTSITSEDILAEIEKQINKDGDVIKFL